MQSFSDLYLDLTPSQREFVHNVLNEADRLRGKDNSPYNVLVDFASRVKTGGKWDVKSNKNVKEGAITNEYLGNLMFGMSGTIIGIEPTLLIAAAAAQQKMKNNGTDYGNGGILEKIKLTALVNWEYLKGGILDAFSGFNHNPLNYGTGDNDGDSQKILDGINIAQNAGYETNIGLIETNDSGAKFLIDKANENLKDFIAPLINWLDKIAPQFAKDLIARIYDPIALDLNNDGKISINSIITNKDNKSTTNNQSSQTNLNGVYFDHNSDGIAFKSAWIGKDDGLLAYDKNNNNLIDNGSELFGNFTPKSNGEFATDGFNALLDFDTNNDGTISNLDDNFNNLKVWQDLNSNGVSEINELKSLDELGIKALNLNSTDLNLNLGNGNTQISQSTFIKADSSLGLIADINFNVDTISRKFSDEVNLTEADLARPNIKGTGFLRDLRAASALDENLANLLNSYLVATTKSSQLNLLDVFKTTIINNNVNFKFVNLSLVA